MDKLIEVYKEYIENQPGNSIGEQLLRDFLLNRNQETNVFNNLLENSMESLIEGPRDFLQFIHHVLSLIFVYRSNFSGDKFFLYQLKEMINLSMTNGVWKEFQLGSALVALACDLTQEPMEEVYVNLLPKGSALIEPGLHTLDGQIPHPIMNAELALVWIFLGWTRKNEDLVSAGIKLASSLMNLFDSEGVPFHALWLKEEDYQPEYFFSIYTLLFSISFSITQCPKMEVFSHTLLKELRNVLKDLSYPPPVFPILFSFAWNERLPIEKRELGFPEESLISRIDKEVGFSSFQSDNFTIACTASGVNTGLGALYKKGVRIISYGPHFSPLADSSRFGLFRTCGQKGNSFNDIAFENNENDFQFKGWSRLISPCTPYLSRQNFTNAEPGDQWIFFDVQVKKEVTELTIKFLKTRYDSLYFVFFVSATTAYIKEKKGLVTGSLSRYQGETHPIVMENKESKLVILPHFSTEMQVIPLAGKKHFWAADFLIAFPIHGTIDSYSWTIT